MGESGADIKLSKSAQEKVPLAIECKARAKVAIYTDYDQARYHARESSLIPIVVIKADRREPLVILDFNKFLEIIKDVEKV